MRLNEPSNQPSTSASLCSFMKSNGVQDVEIDLRTCHVEHTGANCSESDESFGKIVMKELRTCLWYWGSISAVKACHLLRGRPIGTFLVRDSHSDNCIFSVSYVTADGIFHSRLPRFNGRFCMGGPNALIRSPSLVDFLEQAIRSSGTLRILMHDSSMESVARPVEIRYPLTRTEFLPSLKYFCRLSIRHAIADTGGRVESLPLPKKLRRFIASSTYLLVC